MNKIIIIGANSYIARNMLYILNACDNTCEIKLYDREDNHKDGDVRYEKIDILDTDSVEKIDFDCDIIYMFIGKTGSSEGFLNYNLFIDVNERGLLNVLNIYVKKCSKAKIVFPSTRLVYKGSSCELIENAEKEFNTIYAINKFACEQYLKMYNKVYGLRYSIMRICIPYGTMIKNASSYGTAEFMLSKAKSGTNITLYGDGKLRRTIVHMNDLCKILYLGGISNECVNDVYNIGGEDYSLFEMAKLIAEKYGVGIDYIDWPEMAKAIESGSTVFCDDKLQKILNYSYEYSFEKWIYDEE